MQLLIYSKSIIRDSSITATPSLRMTRNYGIPNNNVPIILMFNDYILISDNQKSH